MAGIPREILKWIQSLDLTWQIKTPKWDLTNGYLIAEIFSWYFPQEVQMHMYNNGTSLDSKHGNWSLLEIFIKRHKLDIPEKYVEGTIHCKEGAAQLLMIQIHEILTNRKIADDCPEEADFTDYSYQMQLPIHARSTATQAVKNNVRITEIMADRNIILGQQKAQGILDDHVEHRRQERVEDPARFNRKPTLGELAVRRPPALSTQTTQVTEDRENSRNASQASNHSAASNRGSAEAKAADTSCKEIQVHQLVHTPAQTAAGC